MYSLVGIAGNRIPGRFYPEEIRKLNPSDAQFQLQIEAVLDEKEVDGEPFSLIRYKGVPGKEYTRWIPTKDLLQ